jgi:hypothetical protein
MVAVESGRMRVVPPWPPTASKEQDIRNEWADRIAKMGHPDLAEGVRSGEYKVDPVQSATVQSPYAGFKFHSVKIKV